MDTTTLDNPEEEIWQSLLTLLTALKTHSSMKECQISSNPSQDINMSKLRPSSNDCHPFPSTPSHGMEYMDVTNITEH